MRVGEFLEEWYPAIADAVLEQYPPIYTQETRRNSGIDLSDLLRMPLLAQADCVRALTIGFDTKPAGLMVGEMGTGKTFCGSAIVSKMRSRREYRNLRRRELRRKRSAVNCVTAGLPYSDSIAPPAPATTHFKRILILCPPHLTKKWVREIENTDPDAWAKQVHTPADLRVTLAAAPRNKNIYVVLSREQAKMGHGWRPVYGKVVETVNDEGEPITVFHCPSCRQPLVDSEEIPVSWKWFKHKRYCGNKVVDPHGHDEFGRGKKVDRVCGEALWTAEATSERINHDKCANPGTCQHPFAGSPASINDRKRYRRLSVAEYIHRSYKSEFDLLVVDEAHEYKSGESAQGYSAGLLAECCPKVLVLTGTLLGGYASTLFYILYRFSPEIRAEFGYHDRHLFVSRYGYLQWITKYKDDGGEFGAYSRRRKKNTTEKELPGVTPPILFELVGNSVFLRLRDVADDLPEYTERVLSVDMEPQQGARYEKMHSDVLQAVKDALKHGSKRLLAAYLQALLAWPDNCVVAETVVDPVKGDVIGHAAAMPEDGIYPKEQELINLVRDNQVRGRRTLVYITHTGTRDLGPRVKCMLEREGFRVAYLRADRVQPEKREQWIADRVSEGIDVLLTNPNNVKTGLDLIDFPSIAWLETDYSTYTLRQASRRSWRIGQANDVEVTYLVYNDTLQAEALALIAKKLQASLMVEGELPDDGLAVMGADEQSDLMLSLARKMANFGSNGHDSRSLEALFAHARESEAREDRYVIDGEWRDVAPEVAVEAPALPGPSIFDLPPLVVAEPEKAATNGHRKQKREPQTLVIGITKAPRETKKAKAEVAAGQLAMF